MSLGCSRRRGFVAVVGLLALLPAHAVTAALAATEQSRGAAPAGLVDPVTNPVANRNMPDPGVVRGKGDARLYHLYHTGGTDEDPFPHHTSPDLVTWTEAAGQTFVDVPRCIEDRQVPGDRVQWAPDIAKVAQRLWVLTFTCGKLEGRRKVGYATARRPGGPFEFRGFLVRKKDRGPNGIDPHIARIDGKRYLTWGGGHIAMVELRIKPGKRKPVRPVRDKRGRLAVQWLVTGCHVHTWQGRVWATVEGGWLHKRKGKYYLFHSFGRWQREFVGRSRLEYRVRVRRASSLEKLGHASKSAMIAATRDKKCGKRSRKRTRDLIRPEKGDAGAFHGPGALAIVRDDARKDWILYHSWQPTPVAGDAAPTYHRPLMLDRIRYRDGWPRVRRADKRPSRVIDPLPVVR